jgi:hypothetical protein
MAGTTRFSLAAGLLALLLPALCGSAAADEPFLARFEVERLIASTVPGNGDINPYGVAVVPQSIGRLRQGDILVSNFNNSSNLQGTGQTIMQLSPGGRAALFAFIDPNALPGACPGGVGLTTALAVLRRGWVIVGSLPTSDGTAATAGAGCLIVLDSHGQVAEVFSGQGLNGPWDMTAADEDERALLFVSNVLNGDVTSGAPHRVDQGTVLRIELSVPRQGHGKPQRLASTVIGSGFPETADPNALVIGPTGLALGHQGTLYVADSIDNRVAAIPDALRRNSTAHTGEDLSVGGALNDPLGLVATPDGDVIAANGGDGNLVEITPQGRQAATRTVETATGAGSLFGLVLAPEDGGVYFVDDGDNTLKVLTRRRGERD